MDDCNLVKVSRDFMRAPDRGRVVAHAYRDDAVIAICRQKRTHGGAMALVLAPSTGAPPRGIRAAPNPPETVLRRLQGRSGGGAKCWGVGVSFTWSCCAVRWSHRSRCTLRDICLSGRVSCISRAIDSVVSLRREICG
jgi:hypothetical protein